MWSESDVMKQWKNLLLVAHVFFLTCSWEMLFSESKDTDVFKADRNELFASNEKQIDSHTLMLVMLHSNMSILCTYLYIGAFKKIFWCGFCSLLIFLAKNDTKGTELQFLCTQGTLKGGRVEDHRMIFTIGTCIHHNYIFKQYST